MQQQKPGYKTTEFWVTALVNIVAAVVTVLGVRGLVSAEEGNAYVAVACAVATAVAPLAAAFVSGRYITSRSEVKSADSLSKRQ